MTVLAVYPLFAFALCGLIIHQRWPWAICLVSVALVYYSIASVSATRVAVKQALGAIDDFLSPIHKFHFVAVDILQDLDPREFATYRNLGIPYKVLGRPSQREMDPRRLKPLYSLVVSDESGCQVISCSRAYVNGHGRSFVFLHKHPDMMSGFDKFLLYHELDHVTKTGASGAELIDEMKASGLVTSLLLFTATSSAGQRVAIGILLACQLWFLWSLASLMREIIADNNGIGRLNKIEEVAKVGRLVSDLFRDYMLGASTREDRAHWGFRYFFICKQLESFERQGLWSPLHYVASINLLTGLGFAALGVWLSLAADSLSLSFFALAFVVFAERFWRGTSQWGKVFKVNQRTRELLDQRGLLVETWRRKRQS